ncbi:MAG: neutral zinc metallopeptidase [Proteobacteria bacterium]|nr:neutral zinc metallopeptidase [Pseudomonadota bacterium]
MRWKDGRRSSNVEDRRGQSAGYNTASSGSGLLSFIPMLVRSKTGRIILLLGVVVVFGGKMMGIDLMPMLLGGGGAVVTDQPYELTPAEKEMGEFVSVVLADTEDTWKAIFREQGGVYQEPTLVLFTGRVNSACGMASAAVGPFYCPGDQQLYVDLSFFQDLSQRHDAPGDFAQAYVIAHEVGHHVQTLLGVSDQVRQAGRGKSKAEVNALSVRQELQADCFAGLWGHAANIDRHLLDPGDLEEALTAATAIGDDRLQREAGRSVVPDSFTHGTSAQRVKWFRKGFESGDIAVCDTFSASHN